MKEFQENFLRVHGDIEQVKRQPLKVKGGEYSRFVDRAHPNDIAEYKDRLKDLMIEKGAKV